MLFPWVGMLEQIRLADVVVHYDDVQFSKGGFTNRVQLKTAAGTQWMTIPLRDRRSGMAIHEVQMAPAHEWRGRHDQLLEQSFHAAPHKDEALALVNEVYEGRYPSIGHLSRTSMLALGRYFGLLDSKHFLDAHDLGIDGVGSSRVLDIVRAVGGTNYITGHGASNYLNHEAFERAGVQVQYMHYECRPYPQEWGAFTPYVSGLDLVASLGRNGVHYIVSQGVPWRDFLHASEMSRGQR
jgi:hypothetical protein